jgi:glutathionylspermidine synthase
MKRVTVKPRAEWRPLIEQQGCTWHSLDNICSWNEGAAYVLTRAEVENLQQTAEELHGLYLKAAASVMQERRWQRFGLTPEEGAVLLTSYKRDDWSLMGRFDFMLDEDDQFKLIEYNPDVALTLMETAVIQQQWQRDHFPCMSQWNQLRESVVHAWSQSGFQHVHCAWRPRHAEIGATAHLMAEWVRAAGLQATLTAMHCLGWHNGRREFVDGDDAPVECCWKVYPWDWMLKESFARHVAATHCRFVEPAWRHLLSSKAMLALLWEHFPDHPALLPCYADETRHSRPWVSKPLFGREGNNILIRDRSNILQQTGGEFDGQRRIHQQMARSPRFDGRIPQFGVWMVRDRAVALGMREDDGLIIQGHSLCTPHLVE